MPVPLEIAPFRGKNGFVPLAADALPPAFPRMAHDMRFYRMDRGAAAA